MQMDDGPSLHIQRKPVPPPRPVLAVNGSNHGLSEKDEHTELPPPPYAGSGFSPDWQALEVTPRNEKDSQLALEQDEEARPPLPTRPAATGSLRTVSRTESHATDASSRSLSGLGPQSPGVESAAPATDASKSFLSTALSETRHFATGLMPHPTVSTKHYTILRHSPALILYRGPTTALAITVFSSPDRGSLPPDRSLWLQRRGFSGDTGLRLRTLVGATSTWLDVTPALRVEPAEVAARADERDWARDIARVARRQVRERKTVKAHVARETMVVRLPARAGDGYFRAVLCAGGRGGDSGDKRRVLCASPVFRVASTKLDSSVVRGASLKTAPLELGVKIGSMIGRTAAGNYVSAAASPLQAQIRKYEPGFLQREAGETAFWATGAGRAADVLGEEYRQRRETSFDPVDDESQDGAQLLDALDGGEDTAPPEVIGPDEGPQKPFPITFQGKVVPGAQRALAGDQAQSAIPTASLAGVPEDIRLRLREGVYFGWACVLPKRGVEGISHDWHEAVIAIGPSPYAAPRVVVKRAVTVHLLHDFGDSTFFDCKMKAMILGFLRPMKANRDAGPSEVAATVVQDATITLASLSRENWGPEMTMERERSDKSSRSFSERYVDARQTVQTQVDRISFHLAGVRTAGAELRDTAHGNGGFWVPR